MQHFESLITKAKQIHRTETPENEIKVADKRGRQGDVNVWFRGPAKLKSDTIPSAAVIAEGQHGGHVLLGHFVAEAGTNLVHIGPEGAVLIHTDSPKERHGAILFHAGCWEHRVSREMNPDTMLPEDVKD